MAWLTPVLWPFLRVLAMFTAAPVFSMRAIPVRARIGLAFLVAVCAQAALPQPPVISLNSPEAAGVVLQQVGIGLAIGFAVRVVFVALEFAGEVVGLQMGLNFASFFDPSSNSQKSTAARFLGQIALLLFVVMNGHLLVLLAVIESFQRFPVDGNFLTATQQLQLHSLGTDLFASALWLALPVMILLLFVNFAMGIMSRVAPQMQIFSFGFPVTISIGLLGITAMLPNLDQPLLHLLELVLDRIAKHA